MMTFQDDFENTRAAEMRLQASSGLNIQNTNDIILAGARHSFTNAAMQNLARSKRTGRWREHGLLQAKTHRAVHEQHTKPTTRERNSQDSTPAAQRRCCMSDTIQKSPRGSKVWPRVACAWLSQLQSLEAIENPTCSQHCGRARSTPHYAHAHGTVPACYAVRRHRHPHFLPL